MQISTSYACVMNDDYDIGDDRDEEEEEEEERVIGMRGGGEEEEEEEEEYIYIGIWEFVKFSVLVMCLSVYHLKTWSIGL
ncbi:hypothetical protein BOTCAL_1496g00010 [Botryotinia calthae]|uniref:Uncharacterized protein n=1 Tax=Botryotinia calthae TaxID=38488 RepID=A0A4Y8CDF2_9HELO|nr:hypothetical protein BOTCAL_1496g00010 [Botryotinia calthae]